MHTILVVISLLASSALTLPVGGDRSSGSSSQYAPPVVAGNYDILFAGRQTSRVSPSPEPGGDSLFTPESSPQPGSGRQLVSPPPQPPSSHSATPSISQPSLSQLLPDSPTSGRVAYSAPQSSGSGSQGQPAVVRSSQKHPQSVGQRKRKRKDSSKSDSPLQPGASHATPSVASETTGESGSVVHSSSTRPQIGTQTKPGSSANKAYLRELRNKKYSWTDTGASITAGTRIVPAASSSIKDYSSRQILKGKPRDPNDRIHTFASKTSQKTTRTVIYIGEDINGTPIWQCEDCPTAIIEQEPSEARWEQHAVNRGPGVRGCPRPDAWVGFHKGDGTKQDNKLPVAVLLGGHNHNTVRIYKCPHCQYGVVGMAHEKNCVTRTDN